MAAQALSPRAFGRRAPTIRPRVFAAYWYFAHERQRIFEARLAGETGPWTDDDVLRDYRFCNSFRASDRVTQALIQTAAYGAPDLEERDLFVRVVLFRLFSRTSTWTLLEDRCGLIRAATFDAELYGDILDDAFASGARLYTAAFILAPPTRFGYTRKHRNHLALVDAMLSDRLPERLAEAPTMRSVFEELRSWHGIGPFLAYQLTIDLNYSPLLSHCENDFTVPGPGAIRGLAKVFEDLKGWAPDAAIHWLVDRQADVEQLLGIRPPDLFGRPLHAIDCQNLLCEVDKYSRVAFPELRSGRIRIKQRFAASSEPLQLLYPPKWGLRVPAAARAAPG